jgi:hypothetical protein
MNFAGNFCKACSLDFTNLIKLSSMQGVYYYFYQLLRNEAEARAQKSKKRGNADASVGMLTSLVIAALAGYKFLLLLTLQVVSCLHLSSRILILHFLLEIYIVFTFVFGGALSHLLQHQNA